jgi:MFS family permease
MHLTICRAIKTMVADSCDASEQPVALGVITFAWGLGSILGPLIAGLLADPCATLGAGFPGCERSSGLFVDRRASAPKKGHR